MSKKQSYVVLQPIKIGPKKKLIPDASKPVAVDLEPEQAAPLVSIGVLAPADDAAAAALGGDAGGESNLPAERPADANAVLEAIRQATAKLDPDNEDHWTKAGLPDTRALEHVLGWQVAAAERDKSGATKPE